MMRESGPLELERVELSGVAEQASSATCTVDYADLSYIGMVWN